MEYFFILGKTPDLSILELNNFAKASRMLGRVILAESDLDADDLMRRLGGTVKIGKIWEEVRSFNEIKPKNLADFVLENCETGKKIYFGFSVEGKLRNFEIKKLRKLGLDVKELLKEKGIKSRFVTSREQNLSSVVVKRNKLVSRQGVELIFIFDKSRVLIGKTLAVQEFEEFSARDYGRPSRDVRVGMLPPKLALMMVNIARVDTSKIILDPFCGSGTILQEAALLGFKNIIGCDVSLKMVEASKKNLKWLSQRFRIGASDLKIFQSDVAQLAKKIQPNSIDAIVAEPCLGPPFMGGESRSRIQKIRAELSSLYLRAFREFKKVLKKDGVVVIVFPIFAGRGGENVYVDILDKIKWLGFDSVLGDAEARQGLISVTNRGSIIYSRPGQKVIREVFKFRC